MCPQDGAAPQQKWEIPLALQGSVQFFFTSAEMTDIMDIISQINDLNDFNDTILSA